MVADPGPWPRRWLEETYWNQKKHHGGKKGLARLPAVVKDPPANAGDTGSSPGPGRSHMLQSN